MKNKITNKGLALSAVGGALSLVLIILSYYIKNISLTLNVAASIGVMIPLCKNYYKEGLFSLIAIILLGAIFININILPFALLSGSYTYFVLFAKYKKPFNKFVLAIIKLIYGSLVFYLLYKVFNLIGIDLSKYNLKLDIMEIYFLLYVIFIIAFYIFDYMILMGFNYLKKYVR